LRVLEKGLVRRQCGKDGKATIGLLDDHGQRQPVEPVWRLLDDARLQLQPLCCPDDVFTVCAAGDKTEIMANDIRIGRTPQIARQQRQANDAAVNILRYRRKCIHPPPNPTCPP
jgi:hypothetical protein